MQDIWNLAVSWDDVLPADILQRWSIIAADLDLASVCLLYLGTLP